VLIVRAISPGASAYYLGPDSGGPGRWLETAGARRLGLNGPVERPCLESLLKGAHPLGEGPLVSSNAATRAGWDLMFSAPKSVSLLAAGPLGEGPAQAHRQAVENVIEVLEAELLVRAGRPRTETKRSVVAACFAHTRNAAGEPHLHSHVLLANLAVDEAGRWSRISGSEWGVRRRALFALYRLGLRYHLGQAGFDLAWRISPGGLADLACVPRSAIRAASQRGADASAMGPHRSRHLSVAQPSQAAVQRAAREAWGQSKASQTLDNLSVSGFGPALAGEAAASAGPKAAVSPTLEQKVTRLLASQKSAFGTADVVVALANCVPAGLDAKRAWTWAQWFCAASRLVPSPTCQPRWTTELAAGLDERLTKSLLGAELPAGRAHGLGRPKEPLSPAQRDGPSYLAHAQEALVACRRPVTILSAQPGRTGLLANAEVLYAAARHWEKQGLRVGLEVRTARDAARWRALTGLDVRRGPCEVVVVDQCDRRSSAELIALAETWRARRLELLVLIEGGTMPRRSERLSASLCALASQDDVPVAPAGLVPSHWLTGPVAWGPGRVAWDVVEAWLNRLETGKGDGESVMVGLGPDEVAALNLLAQSRLSDARPLQEPSVACLGHSFARGDQVVALSGRTGGVYRGRRGEVTALRTAPPAVVVSWHDGGSAELQGRQLSRLGHLWALAPDLAARDRRAVVLLGGPQDAPQLSGRVASFSTACELDTHELAKNPTIDLGHLSSKWHRLAAQAGQRAEIGL